LWSGRAGRCRARLPAEVHAEERAVWEAVAAVVR